MATRRSPTPLHAESLCGNSRYGRTFTTFATTSPTRAYLTRIFVMRGHNPKWQIYRRFLGPAASATTGVKRVVPLVRPRAPPLVADLFAIYLVELLCYLAKPYYNHRRRLPLPERTMRGIDQRLDPIVHISLESCHVTGTATRMGRLSEPRGGVSR